MLPALYWPTGTGKTAIFSWMLASVLRVVMYRVFQSPPPQAMLVVSCRQQIEHGTGRKARHLAEVLRDSLA